MYGNVSDVLGNVSDILLNKMNNELNTLLDSPLARACNSCPQY